MKFRPLWAAIALIAFLTFTSAAPLSAAPGESGDGYGGCIDNLYGNATNQRPDGNGVIPSQSPGPWVNTGFNEPPRNDRQDGISVGEVMQITTGQLELNGAESMLLICTFP